MMLKQCLAAMCAALMLSAPITADAHILSSAQEKNIGTKAAKKYEEKHNCHEDPILTHIQDRIMSYNQDKLWMYGTPGHKRGLERVLLSSDNNVNATSYGGGQIYIYQGLMDALALQKYGKEKNAFRPASNPWKKCNIYQMSALAGIMGHEMGHWENEDMLKDADSRFATAGIVALIPVANVYTALLAAAGGNVINMFSSRQLSFDAEKAADAKGIEYCAPVPEYSIGSLAAWHYRCSQLFPDSQSFGNWLKPHSKNRVRVQRVLETVSKTSKGFFEWKGDDLELYMDGASASPFTMNNVQIALPPREDVGTYDRTFYVVGQLAMCIQYGIADRDNLQYRPENEVFTDGSSSNTVLVLEGKDRYNRTRTKIIDSYHMPKDRLITLCGQFEKYRNDDKEMEKLKKSLRYDELSDVYSLVYTKRMLAKWEDRKYHYMMKVQN